MSKTAAGISTGIAFLLTLAAFGLMGLTAITDLRYLMYAKTVDGELLSAVRGGGDPDDKRVHVEYSFADVDGSIRNEKDKLPAHWSDPQGKTIPVAFIPSVQGASHVAGNWDGYWLFMLGFLGVLGGLVGIPAYLSYSANEKKRAARDARRASESDAAGD